MAGLKKKRRIQIIIAAFGALTLATGLIGYGMRDGINLYRAPSEVAAAPPDSDEVFRIGGLVVQGSIIEGEGVAFRFDVTDCAATIPVSYVGNDPRPDLFSDGQGTIATGQLIDGVFVATVILAKHDESYMPREVENSLVAAGPACSHPEG